MHNTHNRVLAIIILTLLPYSHTSWAESKIQPPPLHIKIAPHNASKSTGKINIIKAGHPPPDENQAHPIKSTPCLTSHIDFSNRAKDLADSLKSYLKSEQRDPTLIDALYHASLSAHIDFDILVIHAMIESNLGLNTRSRNSTARGIFQYIDSTWLSLIKEYGARIGYKNYADSVTMDFKTQTPTVNTLSPYSKDTILALRDDVKISALIKAYHIKDEAETIQSFKGYANTIDTTDHYIAHMLGIPMARALYTLNNTESSISIADSNNGLFKQASLLNPYFFQTPHGDALTAAQVYVQFKKKIVEKYQELDAIYTKYGKQLNESSQCTNTNTIRTAQKNIGLPAFTHKANINFHHIKMD